MPNTLPNVILVGFTGVGKSTIGRQLAATLEMAFIDTDAAVEAQTGNSCTDIIINQGEATFRLLEENFIYHHLPRKGHVIACGGGLPTISGMMNYLKSQGLVIYLSASQETLLARIGGTHSRPLISDQNKAKSISDLLAQRIPLYSQGHYTVDTNKKSINDTISELRSLVDSSFTRHYDFNYVSS